MRIILLRKLDWLLDWLLDWIGYDKKTLYYNDGRGGADKTQRDFADSDCQSGPQLQCSWFLRKEKKYV